VRRSFSEFAVSIGFESQKCKGRNPRKMNPGKMNPRKMNAHGDPFEFPDLECMVQLGQRRLPFVSKKEWLTKFQHGTSVTSGHVFPEPRAVFPEPKTETELTGPEPVYGPETYGPETVFPLIPDNDCFPIPDNDFINLRKRLDTRGYIFYERIHLFCCFLGK